MPPTIAISELSATRPETAAIDWADITLKPNQPMQRSQVPRASQGIELGGIGPAVGAVAAGAGAEAEDRGEGEPAADGVDDDRAGEIVERGAEGRGEPGLDAEIAVPDEAFAEGIDEADDDRGGEHLRPELCALGDAARDDRGDGGGEGREEEEFDEAEALRRRTGCLRPRRRGSAPR